MIVGNWSQDGELKEAHINGSQSICFWVTAGNEWEKIINTFSHNGQTMLVLMKQVGSIYLKQVGSIFSYYNNLMTLSSNQLVSAHGCFINMASLLCIDRRYLIYVLFSPNLECT